MPKKPLEGVKVLDFCWSVVGPLATKLLSDYGAEVIKVESRKRPDLLRVIGPFKDGIVGLDRANKLAVYSTGKISVAINLTNPKGMALIKKLVAWADVVTENYAGGSGKKMGLGYEELRKVNPDLIMVSSAVMGQEGPYASLPGFGGHLAAMAGFRNIAGWPDREPAELEVYTDFVAPHFMRLAVLTGIDYHRRTGKGKYFDLSQYEGAMHFIAPLILDKVVNNRTAGREGNNCPYAAPHNAYPCRGEDRWCAIAVFTDKEWKDFCRVIGNPAWTKRAKFATLVGRKENEAELDELIGKWTINHTAEEVMTMMQESGVAAGVVETTEDMLDHDPQLKSRHFYTELDHPEIGKYRGYRSSFILSKSPCELRRGPLLGEHNEYVLKNILGMSDEEIAQLIIDGVIE